MEMHLNNLIEKIKTDGIKEADKKAEDILKKAQAEAQGITDKAKIEAEEIIKKAQAESARLKKLAEESVRQAARDTVLSLRQEIIELFDSILKRAAEKALAEDSVKSAVARLIENFRKDGSLNIEILLPKDKKEDTERYLLSALKEEMKKGVTFRASRALNAGFRIGEKDSNYYYDFSAGAVAEALKAYLNPGLVKILDGQNET